MDRPVSLDHVRAYYARQIQERRCRRITCPGTYRQIDPINDLFEMEIDLDTARLHADLSVVCQWMLSHNDMRFRESIPYFYQPWDAVDISHISFELLIDGMTVNAYTTSKEHTTDG